MNPTNILLLTLSTLAILATLGVGLSWYFARHFCTPRRKLSNKTPGNFHLAYEAVTLSSQDVSLNGWFIPGPDQSMPQPTIVIAHGWSSSMVQMLPVAAFLHKEGFSSLLYDARSHGTSADDIPITLQKFAQDMMTAIKYLGNREDVDLDRIGVFGHSMGGSGAILAISEGLRVHALVSSSAFADPVALTKRYMAMYNIPRGPLFYLVCFFINRWLDTNMEEIAPKNRIQHISIPILLLHGKSDQKISSKNMEILRSQAQSEYLTTRLISGDVTHSTIIFDTRFRNEIIDFFKTHLDTKKQLILEKDKQLEIAS